MTTIKICWIVPQYSSLSLKPGRGSPLLGLLSSNGEIGSYDSEINFPHSTAIISTARKLQSALPQCRITCAILNLAAVPRNVFAKGVSSSSYIGEPYLEIPFGRSTIEARRMGVDIENITQIHSLLRGFDLIVIPSSFESHINELKKIGSFIKTLGLGIPIMASGNSVQGHEEQLLDAGFDVVFSGAVTDDGELLLKALLEKDEDFLADFPGVYMNLTGRKVRNQAPRNFRQRAENRLNNIKIWKNGLHRYEDFAPLDFQMTGREDLKCGIVADPVIQHCCTMQDLDYEDLVQLYPAGEKIVFAADEFFMTVGCPRTDCFFCHASGKGSSQRRIEYSLALLDFYKNLGATDLIPTDDQVLLHASQHIASAEALARIFERACEHRFTFSYGNGLETLALLKCFEKVEYGNREERGVYGRLIESFLQSLAYIYLPYERLEALTGHTVKLPAKLKLGKEGFQKTLIFLDNFARARGKPLEVGSNIIFSESPGREEMEAYYAAMNEIAKDYSNLSIRFYGFFMIPSNCAPHIIEYREKFSLYSDYYPELKVVSLPSIMNPGEDSRILEQQLAWNFETQLKSKSNRVLANGAYKSRCVGA